MDIGYSEQAERLMRVHYGRLSEREKRLYAAIEAVKLGYGGQTYLKKLLGVDYKTICHGKKELRQLSSGEMIESGRQRKVGGGRKKKRLTVP